MKLALLILVALVLLPFTFAAAQEDTSTWAGNYFVNGIDALGVPYEAGLEILDAGGWTQLLWSYPGAAVAETGVGLPLNDTQMAVSYDITCVIQVFNIGENGALSGPWAQPFAGLGEEAAIPTNPGETIGGTYDVLGTNPDATNYEGTLEIIPISTDLYTLVWTLGALTYEGAGMLIGDQLIAAADTIPEIPCGVGLMTWTEEGTINGTWWQEGTPDVYSDTATPIVLADSYTVNGTSADGTTYTNTLTFSGDAFRYIVSSDDQPIGVGVLRGNVLNIAVGGEQCAVLNRALLADGRMFTRNATQVNETIGTTLQTPNGETEGYLGTFDLIGSAATGANTQGSTTISGGENGIYHGAGEATRSTGETVNVEGIFILTNGMIAGVYAPGGDVTPCGVLAGVIGADGVITMPYIYYGGTEIEGTDIATPDM